MVFFPAISVTPFRVNLVLWEFTLQGGRDVTEQCWHSHPRPAAGRCAESHGQTHPRERPGIPGVWAIACQHRAAWLWFLFASVNVTSQLLPLRQCPNDHSYQAVIRLEIMHESSAVFRYY